MYTIIYFRFLHVAFSCFANVKSKTMSLKLYRYKNALIFVYKATIEGGDNSDRDTYNEYHYFDGVSYCREITDF
jgi:hypothetical protein